MLIDNVLVSRTVVRWRTGVGFRFFLNLLFVLVAGWCLMPTAHAYGLNQCAAQRAGSDLNCTANDVSITQITPISGSYLPYCVGGQTLTLDLNVSVKFGSATRYGVGIFLANDGKTPQKLSANGGAGSCSVASLPLGGTSPFFNLDNDACGDGNNSVGTGGIGAFTMSSVALPCTTDGTGNTTLYAPYVVTWALKSDALSGSCTGAADVAATNGAKCNTGQVDFTGVSIIVMPSITKTVNRTTTYSGDTVTYTVVIANNTGSNLPADSVAFTDPVASNLSVVSNGVSCTGFSGGANCPDPSKVTVAAMQSTTGITLPAMPNQSSVTFTITATVTGTPASVINTASVKVGGQANSASNTLVVMVPPTAAKSFSPATIVRNGTSTLKITLSNPNSIGVTGVAFTDTYPNTSLKNAGTLNLINTCGGTATASSGGSSLSLSGGTIPAGGSCYVSVDVTSATANAYPNNTGTITTSNSPSNTGGSSATLTVMGPPTVSESFTPSTVSVYSAGCSGCTSTFSVTINNPNSAAITGAKFSDVYSSTNLQNVGGATWTCTDGTSGSATAAAGGSSLSIDGSGLTIPVGGSCAVSATVKAAAVGGGAYYATNTGSGTSVTTTNSGGALATRATLNVTLAAPIVTKTFSPAVIAKDGKSTLTIKIANPNSVSIGGVGFTDSYPSGMANFIQLLPLVLPTATTSGCGFGIASASLLPATSATLIGATVLANDTCVVTVKDVTATDTVKNDVGVTSTNAAPGSGSGMLYVTKKMVLVADPTTVPNDGTTFSTVTATITDAAGNPVPGDVVTLSCTGSGPPVITTVNGTTDALGKATFKVTDTQMETITCTASDSTGLSAAVSVVFSSVNSFNAFEGTTAANAIVGPIYTKLAGTAFSLDVVAVSGSSKASGFAGSVKLELIANTGTAGSGYGSDNCPTSSSVIQTLSPNPAISGGRSKVNFAAVANAYRDVRVRISYPAASPTIIVCSTDSFAIRPLVFTVSSNMTNTALTDAPKATAGSAFTLTAAAGVSSGYDGTPVLDASKVKDHNGSVIAAGTLSGAFDAGTGSSASGADFRYLDVGNILLGTDAVIDSGFTSIDQASGCVPGSTSNVPASDQYGCNIGSDSTGKIGRWYPSHYSFAGTLTPACSSGTLPFTYMGNDALGIALTLKAHAWTGGTKAATDPVVSRYTTGYPNLASVTLSGDNGGTAVAVTRLTSPAFPVMPNSALWSAGVFQINDTFSFSRASTPDGPYESFALKAAISDPDGSELIGVATNTTRIRYGRLWLTNAYGNEFLNLPVPMQAQYWSGSATGWRINADDNCTQLARPTTTNSGLTNAQAANTSASMGGSTAALVTLSGGNVRFELRAPGKGNQGLVDIDSSVLTSSGTTATWLPPNTARARACFGLCGPRSSVIYIRERF